MRFLGKHHRCALCLVLGNGSRIAFIINSQSVVSGNDDFRVENEIKPTANTRREREKINGSNLERLEAPNTHLKREELELGQVARKKEEEEESKKLKLTKRRKFILFTFETL